jgi:hypothetical protein
MSVLCISLPRPGPRFRAVIVIVIYLTAFRYAPGQSLPLALGSLLGGLLVTQSQQASQTQERA